ncbi:MAG: hypothetical protein Q7R47_05515, partial [Candidatus Diapherotrites archaeon]|nr:hypothetical protein [Candidatus Diapherotrites archaeon]
KEPVPGKAYWVYNPGAKCKVKAQIRNPVRLGQLDTLLPKWNFVAVTTDMIGKKITELGDCQVRVSYAWNAESKKWQKTTTSTIGPNDLGHAFAVYTDNKCRLGNDDSISPPALPPAEGVNG